MPSFADATAIVSKGTHQYEGHFHEDWCIGSVPHGGYVTSAIQRVARLHFSTTLSAQNQPDLLSLHLEFVRRTSIGPVSFTVTDIKLGRATSLVQISLTQHAREEVLGFITHTNLASESGVSFATNHTLTPPSPPADLLALTKCVNDGVRSKTDDAQWHCEDQNWAYDAYTQFPEFRKAATKIYWFHPRHGQAHPSIADEWIQFRSGEKWTNDTLGYVCDMFPQLIEQYRTSDNLSPATREYFKGKSFWFPTVLLNIDIKKGLPEGGVEWLFTRVRAKAIKNGRYDLEVIVMDPAGDIVALSHHIVMILSAERNMKARRKPDEKEESKL
ncbi:hypothetical protein EJ05DRAFT_511975 [Pseudovirgaria hyperparasitica]|uniref:Thioesterase-like superfamily-domain-containing protein n=1 Tax=Pseudovirgaria hyperparasitica TaxID=470096 RepID=A0A6A6W504_9PEZI|nr:uncharacterized protein EJ05DRAFT_511975 [Pseudovirgaria hyperparasitica]KAF2757259.1 hypothetical protein EJ05DRAFT_511975 [Pseudovirgaria hyperparasitica]